MSSTPPRRLPSFENPLYAKRNESGLYDSIAKQIVAMKGEALANLDYPDNITRTVDERSGHCSFLGSDGNELVVAVVGEIMGPVAGTVVRAQGNHYAPFKNFTPVDDKSNVKDIIAIGVPSCASTMIHNTCLNQNIVLSQISSAIADEDARKEFDPAIKPWSKTLTDREQHDIMMLTLPLKYGVPAAAGAPKAKRVSKRALDEVDDTDKPVAKDADGPAEPSGDDIKIGAFYDPALQEDYGGEYFNHSKAKLAQHDVRAKDGTLIPPWKYYDALRPGTVVLALVTLHVYLMDNKVKNNNGQDKRRCYQINVDSLRVLADSNEPVEVRTIPIPPDGSSRARAALPARAVASFTNFVVPDLDLAPENPKSTDKVASRSGKEPGDVSSVDDTHTPSTPKSSSSSATVDDGMDVDDTPKKPVKKRRT